MYGMMTATAPRLFDVDLDPTPAARWAGSVLPAVYTGPRPCQRCRVGRLHLNPAYTVVPLFRMYGHGYASRVTVAVCDACHRPVQVAVEAINPR